MSKKVFFDAAVACKRKTKKNPMCLSEENKKLANSIGSH